MYLKRLDLQGFKSFAPHTTLEFSPGITAIVGPNGSGKSNVADAIRWVLGEQSMRQLRGKKSDDIIFAGGQGRAAMNMAEVSLILDNSASWLPSERSEVCVTRRSFRSGESEYLINGQRVRLRDMLLLLAQARIGHDSYTVIGQGLVDQALSLRAEERRGLFEDAAGIRQFQAQRTDAEQKLALTQTNLSRLRDILDEIEPRLGPLAEQARRAREYTGARDELRRLVRLWYAWQWQESLAARARADAAEAALAARIEAIQTTLAAEEAHTQEARAARDAATARLAELRRARGEASGRLQAIERDQAVGQERRASVERQAADLVGEQARQEEALAAAQAAAEELDAQHGAAEEHAQALAGQVEALDRAQHTARQEQEREEARLRAAQRDVIQAQARLGAAQTELGRLQRQVGERNRALATRQEAVAAAQRRLDAAQTALEAQRATFEVARAEVQALAAQREDLGRASAAGQEEVEQARAAVADAQRERRAVADRLALLEEWHRGLEGYADGVRAVLQAPADERPPLVGVMAHLVRAAPGFEAAVEAALGPFLQALVVSSPDDALTCAEWLRARGAGHALLIWPPETAAPLPATHGERPTHTPRPVGDLTPPAPLSREARGEPDSPLPVGEGPGMRSGEPGESLASHVDAQPEVRPLLDRLLAGTYIARDLGVAHHVLASTPAVRALVTPTGELLHRDGWARGGAAVEPASGNPSDSGDRAGTLLARERELRQLPAELDRWTAEIAELEARHARADQVQRERRDRAAALERALQAAESRAQELARLVATLQREAERTESERQLSQAVADQLAAETTGLEQEVSATTARVAELETAQQEALERVRDAQEALDGLTAGNRTQQEELARQRTALALLRQEAKALAERAEQVRSQARELALQIERRADRVQALATQRAQLDEETTHQQETLAELRAQLRELSAAMQEQEVALAEAERELASGERNQALARQELGTIEVEYRRRIVDAQRARDAVEALLTQLREELGELGEPVAEGESSDPAALLGLPDPADTQQDAAATPLPAHAPASTETDETAEDAKDAEEGEKGSEQTRRGSPRRSSVSSVPSAVNLWNGERLAPEEAARMRRQIDQLRNRLRHLGGYDPDAPQAYEELKTRYDFLTGQVRDMEQASTNLRTVIAELDATMRRQFAETFQAVNLRFQRHFATLFSGGSARLEMTAPRRKSTDDDDEDDAEFPAEQASSASKSGAALAGGIEIFVQIPGKRVQDLALLSGGERAMVSVALLFALLETNPPPFCLLDEVDAALDEANVVRFCDILKLLAEQTQFIVVTHNRVTMTHARAIYGISMGSDSVSRVLSMRLAEATAAAAR